MKRFMMVDRVDRMNKPKGRVRWKVNTGSNLTIQKLKKRR